MKKKKPVKIGSVEVFHRFILVVLPVKLSRYVYDIDPYKLENKHT